MVRDVGYWERHPRRAAIELDNLQRRVRHLEQQINRWQGIGTRQMLDTAVKIFGEMQREIQTGRRE